LMILNMEDKERYMTVEIRLDPCLKWGTFKKGLQIHVAPANEMGFTNHELKSDCYCNPRFVEKDSVTGKELYVHNEPS
jgi:hypothetical protein